MLRTRLGQSCCSIALFLACDAGKPGCSNGNCPKPQPELLDVRVSTSSDDAEEDPSGSVNLGSSDLELVREADLQTVGIRFQNIPLPQGATVTNAYVQFTVDEATTEATSLTIAGQADDDAPTFTEASSDVSSRQRTQASVSWSPAPWNSEGEAEDQRRRVEPYRDIPRIRPAGLSSRLSREPGAVQPGHPRGRGSGALGQPALSARRSLQEGRA